MIDAQTRTILEEVVRGLGRSLLQYVSDAFPWITAGEQPALAEVQAMAKEERQAAAALARFLARRRLPVPYLGAYPSFFTTINYVTLEYLLPMLLDYQVKAVAGLERDLGELADPEARQQVEMILELKRRHLEKLESLAAAYPGKLSTVV